MATAKKSAAPKKTPAPQAAPAKKAVASKKAAAPAASAPKAAAAIKPIKETFNKTTLAAHLAQVSGVDAKAVKAVMAALESTLLASVHKKGAGEFTLPGLLKVAAVAVPAKKKRVGINPFTKQEQVFAAKPASVKLKVRVLKKVKDAAL